MSRRRATVDPNRIAEVLHGKLYEATLQLGAIREAERPEFNNVDMSAALNNFLASAHGVHPVAETFGKDEVGTPAFVAWCGGWVAQLNSYERQLWNYMREQRNAREHGDGAALICTEIDLPVYDQPNALIYGFQSRTTSSKSGVRFEAYPNQPASEVCQAYLDLCARFVDDYLRDHAAVIAAKASP